MNCSSGYSLEVSPPHQVQHRGGRQPHTLNTLLLPHMSSSAQITHFEQLHCPLCTLCTAFCVHCMMVHSVGGVCPAFIHSTNSSTLGSDAVQGCNIHQHHLILVQLLLLLLLLMMLMIMAQCKVTIYTSSNLILLLLLRFQLKTMKMLQLLKSKEFCRCSSKMIF